MKKVLFALALFCLLAVQGFAASPTTAIASPALPGSGPSSGFVFTANDTDGGSTIGYYVITFGSAWVGPGTCTIATYPNSSAPALIIADDGQTWRPAGITSNSQCSFSQYNKTVSGTVASVFFVINFNQSFAGPQTVWAFAQDSSGNWGGGSLGTWTVPGSSLPTTTLVSPSPGGTSANQTFRFSTNYQGGTGGSTQMGLTATSAFNGNNGFWFYANQAGTVFYLLNDAGNGWVGLDGNGTASNTQGTVSNYSASVAGNITTYTFTGALKPAFAGNRYLWGYSANAAGGANPATMYGSWTIPTTLAHDNASFAAFVESDGPRLGVDTMTNQPMYLEDAMHPLPTINLDTATGDNPAVVMAGSLGTVSIRNAKPNTQVWARGYVFDPISHTSNGDPESDLYYLPNPQATIYSSATWPSGDTSFPGGWLVGTTDSTGKFDLSFQAGAPFGDNAIAMYVGNEAVSSQTGLDGVTRQNYNASLNPTNYFGSVTFFITDNSQSNLPSPFYALEKGKAPSVRTWSQKLIDSCRKAHPVSELDHMACIQKGLEDPQLDQE